MANPRVERLVGVYAPTSAATTNLGIFVPARSAGGTATQKGKRVIAFSCRVVTAGNGTGTVSFGSTTGGVAAEMSTGEVAQGTAGRKVTVTGSDLNGNGVLRTPGAAAEFFTGTYVVGTNTVHPVIRWVATVINEEEADKHLLVA